MGSGRQTLEAPHSVRWCPKARYLLTLLMLRCCPALSFNLDATPRKGGGKKMELPEKNLNQWSLP